MMSGSTNAARYGKPTAGFSVNSNLMSRLPSNTPSSIRTSTSCVAYFAIGRAFVLEDAADAAKLHNRRVAAERKMERGTGPIDRPLVSTLPTVFSYLGSAIR
jgi:hypothetical protein